MAADEKWYFTKEELANTPSTKCGYDADKELSCRQQAAHLIQDMGQRLQVSQLCINTAMVYMHRFYVFHSFSHFHLDAMAAAALFLAAKVEEQPRKLEHVIRVKQICLHREQPALDVKSEQYLEQAQDLVFNENVLLQTLGFDVAIDHPHTYVVRCCQLVRASKDLAQTSYFMASNSLHLTTMCLQYKPTVVACFCIHLACKWSNWEIPQSNQGKYWFYYIDRTVTQDLLEQLTDEFLVIFEKCPSRLKKKIKSANQNPSNYQFDKIPQQRDTMHEGVSFQSHHRPQDPSKPSSSQLQQSSSQRGDSREYQEKRERERQMAPQGTSAQHRDGHHRSHHVAHPHPTSAAALLKPHAGAAAHGKLPHPSQHRSLPPHHPRSDHHQQRPEHPVRSDLPPRPDYPARQDRQARPEHGVRPDHHPRADHQPRPEQVRTDHHPVRPEHQQRSDHPNRVDHHQRPEHHVRPDHQARPDHPPRTDHLGSQRLDSLNRPEPSGRPDQVTRQDQQGRLEHQTGPERQDRSESNERLVHADQRHSGVTAARDQLRREAALQREACRRESFALSSNSNTALDSYPRHRSSLPGNDRRLSSGSSSSGNFGVAGVGSTSSAGSSSVGVKDKQQAVPYMNNQQHLSGRHRRPHETLLNVPPTNRDEPFNTTLSLDRKMQEISEKRQLESFFGKTEALERINEKHQVKQVLPYKEVKKEPESSPAPSQHLQTPMPSTLHIKREKVSPTRQSSSMGPPSRVETDMTSSVSMLHHSAMLHNSHKPPANQYSTLKNIKMEHDAESVTDSRNGTTIPTLLTPKIEKMDNVMKVEAARLPPVKSSIFSPEKTLPKERELTGPLRPSKPGCPPSPGIAFGSPPVTPGKAGSSNRNRTASSCSEGEPLLESFKIEKEPGLESVLKDSRIDMKIPAAGSHHSENLSQVPTNRILEQRHVLSTPKPELKSAHYTPNKASSSHDLKSLLQQTSVNPVLQGRSSACLSEDRQAISSPQVPPISDMRPLIPIPIESDLGAVAFPASETKDSNVAPLSDEGTSDHHHHKSKKKKEKKEKHKHKDKDKEKHREEKKHKSKHKEKDKERRKAEAAATEMVQTVNQSKPGITIKIPKLNITPPTPVAAPSSSGSLKLKINLSQIPPASSSSSSKESRKRDRDRSSPGSEASQAKAPKMSNSVDAPKRGGSVGSANHSNPSSKSSYARQNGLESRGGGRHHMQQSQLYSGSKVRRRGGMHGRPFGYDSHFLNHMPMSFNHDLQSQCVHPAQVMPDTSVPPPAVFHPMMYYSPNQYPYSYPMLYTPTPVFSTPPPPPLPKEPPPLNPPPPPPPL